MEPDATPAPSPPSPQGICPMGGRGAHAPSEGLLILHRRDDGTLKVEPQGGRRDGDGAYGLCPVEHLALALGGCLSEFAGRFMERRRLPAAMRLDIQWKVSVQRCTVESLHVTLCIATTLDEMARQTFHRMLDLCPVHKALLGNVDVELEVVELKVEG